jgi:diamine N-acetyltransferase
MNDMIVRVLPTENIKLSELCYEIYQQTYKHLWHDGGLWYMDTCYNQKQLMYELSDPNSEFYFYIINSKPIGYLKINLSASGNSDDYEIERIYLDQAHSGKGIGSVLINFAIQKAIDLGKKKVYLKVMDSSIKPIKFYEKIGFKIISSKLLDFEEMKVEYRKINTMIKYI